MATSRRWSDPSVRDSRSQASRGWRWFGEELDWQTGERIDGYVATGDETFLKPVDDGRWYTSGWLAARTTSAPIEAIHAERCRAARALRRRVPEAHWFGFDSGSADTDFIGRGNDIDSLEKAMRWMADREALMHERVAAVMQQHPAERLCLMAGGPHLAKNDATLDAPGLLPAGGGTVPTIGHWITHQATDQPVLSIWLLHGGGRTGSPDVASTGELVVPDDTLNAALAQRWDQPCLVLTHGDDTERRIAGMHNLTMTCRLGDQVDAIIFTPAVTPAVAD